jgi:hypothetical protein
MTTAAVIDLDAPRAEPAEPVRRPGRAARLLLVAAMVAATGASAAPRTGPRLLATVPVADTGNFAVGAGTLVVQPPTGGSEVTAWNLADGRLRWTATLPVPVFEPTLAEAQGVVLVRSTEPATTALDLRSGAELWTRPGEPRLVTGGNVVLTDAGPSLAEPVHVQVADVRTGQTRWQATLAQGADVSAAREGDHVHVVELGRPRVTLAAADGRELFRTPAEGLIGILGPTLVFADRRSSATVLRGYLDGRQAWTAEVPAIIAHGRPCGAYLCAMGGDEMLAVDPADGTVRWSMRDVLPERAAAGPDRLLVRTSLTGESWVLLDAGTGRTVRDLGAGAWPAGSADLFLRRGEPRPTLVRIDPATGTGRILGPVDTALGLTCQVRADRLICPASMDTVAVWSVPR